ncbi:NAD(P)/FAD-dependent oxidoreductase [Actinoplanes sp. TFC3]|uniref:FAD-dependent oxidoreductase n=1 Tax=Actinoplanes sp. TFC3 TaxID=1710355 RepID=UPI00082DA1A8|nr:NAD(P)/FAD-dependent oxidoreductase [Actinoplanes sp. TFC3]
MTKDIAVIGGGIAGTVTALALHRAGFTARIFEAHDRDDDERGAFVTVAVNGLRALRELDLDPAELLTAGFPTTRNELLGAAGQLLADVPLGGPTSDGLSTTTIRRADLYRALRDKARAENIPISYGKRLHTLTAAEAQFEDGSTATADLFVGADGLHSRTRKALDPEAPAPRYLGLLNAGGFTARPVASVPPPGVMRMAFGRRAFFGWAGAPDGSVWWFANPFRRTPAEPGEFTPAGWHAHLLELFAGDPFPAREIIAASGAALGPWNTWDVPRLPVWRSDHIVLVGDAAHAVSPSSGQGASMAIEDAVVLGRCLGSESDVAGALWSYEKIRRPRVEKVVAYGKRSGSTKAAGPLGARLRDAMMPLVMRMLYRKGNPQGWILDHSLS